MKTIRRYVAREIYISTALVFLALLALFGFFDFIHELADLDQGKYSLRTAMLYVIFSLPGRAYEILPVAALIGTLFALSHLVATTEYGVMRASGLSMRRTVLALAQIGVVLSLVTFLFGEFIAPFSERAAQRLRLKATTSNVIAQNFRSGLWVKDDNKFINVARVMPETVMHNIRIYEFDDDYRLRSISVVRQGEYQNSNVWLLKDLTRTTFMKDKTEVRIIPQATWLSILSPAILNMLMVVPEQMSVWDLYNFIGHLRENRQDAARYETALWQKVVYPFAVLVMIIIALPFANFRGRRVGVGAKVFFGIMLGLTFHLSNRLFGHVGLLNAWSPLISAVLPTILFLATAILMLRNGERR